MSGVSVVMTVDVGITVDVVITLPSVTGVSVKVGSAVGVVSTVSSVLVGGVLEVLLSGRVEIQCDQGSAGVYRI